MKNTFFILCLLFTPLLSWASSPDNCSGPLHNLALPNPSKAELHRFMTTFELSLRLFPRMLSEESLEEIYWPVLEAMVQKSENALPYSLHERKTYALLQSQVTEQLQGPVKKPRVTPPPGKGWETERFDP